MNMQRLRQLVPKVTTTFEFVDATVEPLSLPARIACWFLQRTKHRVHSKAPRRTVEYMEVNVGSLVDLIHAAMDVRHAEMMWDGDIDMVVVGRDHFLMIVEGCDYYPYSFATNIRLAKKDEMRLIGMRVVLTPCVEGFAFILKNR